MVLRILEGQSGVWCQDTGGTLLLPFAYAVDGQLTAEGRAEVTRSGITGHRPHTRYSLTVVTATDCNLGCPYCFQNTAPAEPGRFDPPRIPRAVLDDGTIEKIAAFTGPRMRRAGMDRLFVLLFGGEPLLNPAACRALLTRLGRLAPVTASMVSNGVLLTPATARDLSALGLRSVQVTLDGPRDLHDGIRTSRAGRGTFERIIANLAAAQETTDLRFTLRVNATADVLPRLEELATHLAGRLDASRCVFDVAPVLNYAGLYDAGIDHTGAEVSAVLRGYAAALDHGFEVGWPGAGACGFCTERDGTTGAVVNADGTLYSCWETIGKPGYEVGTVQTGYTDYPDSVWVSCGEFAARESATGSAVFADRLAVGLMELLRGRRRGRPRRTATAPRVCRESAVLPALRPRVSVSGHRRRVGDTPARPHGVRHRVRTGRACRRASGPDRPGVEQNVRREPLVPLRVRAVPQRTAGGPADPTRRPGDVGAVSGGPRGRRGAGAARRRTRPGVPPVAASWGRREQ